MRLLPIAVLGLLAILGCALGKDGDSADTGAAARAVDVLFVVDNSSSMQAEATDLASALDSFEAALGDAGVHDWRAGILTSSVYYDDGATSGVDPGEAGTLVGGGTVDAVDELRVNLLCNAVCWDSNLPSDSTYSCGDPLPGEVSEDYLDCLCGEGSWRDNCGTGQEQPIEAGFMAMCRAVASPPADCYTFPEGAAEVFAAGDEGSNLGVGDRDTLLVILSDEGDSSLRGEDGETANAGEVETVVNAYVALFGALGVAVTVSTIGPAYAEGDGTCLDGAQSWGVERFQSLATGTGGSYEPLTDLDADCAALPMSDIVRDIVDAGVD